MTIVVTGGAGFIGSNIIRALEAAGDGPLLVVDEAEHETRFRTLTGSEADYADKDGFLRLARDGALRDVRVVLHQGACTDTMATDWPSVRATNLDYSLRLLRLCLAERLPLIYSSTAAIYGTGTRFAEDGSCDAPTTAYAWSKYLFDCAVRYAFRGSRSQLVGLRYFNVYGPGEAHKGSMASIIFQLHRQLQRDGVVRLFRGSGGYGDGEQRRDFTWVGDVVAVNRWFLEHPERSGIFNVGTGRSRSFKEVATAMIAVHGGGKIEYVPMPPSLRGRYQSFTEADLSKLRAAGYAAPFLALEEGVSAYTRALSSAESGRTWPCS